MLGRLEVTNIYTMVVLIVGHVDTTITGYIELDAVGGVEVMVIVAAVLGADVEMFSILLTLYCLLPAWWFLLLFLMSLAFLFRGACDFVGGSVAGLQG